MSVGVTTDQKQTNKTLNYLDGTVLPNEKKS